MISLRQIVLSASLAGVPGTIATAASPEFQAAVAASNPLFYYKLDEEPGQAPKNSGSLGNPYNGSYFGDPTLGVYTQLGDTGVLFSNANEWVESDPAAPAAL